ncbi:hypothetical protein [Thalassomonas haliotis]|uniref:Integrase n=1 Tax=Thalassomonas haliotis TaxID=485448 RepID=A0ABY7VFP1_9GAMM|nr:hypothetical protein [Thalassomonas haliotis]WDE12216.1 hypothetical protein H3N35_01640 [Thalassomonas haliotis]
MKSYSLYLTQLWGMTAPAISSVRSVIGHFSEDLIGAKQQNSQEKAL